MKIFSPLEFAERLVEIAILENEVLHEGLKQAAKLVEKTAKDEIGHYQPEVGNFPEWAELKESTQEQRVRQGYTPNDPLLRSGELRDSISSEVEGLEAAIGSDSDIMVYQEFGTSKGIPPRPVLGPAAYRNKDNICKIIGAAAVTGIMGGKKLDQALGYDFETD